MVGIGFQDEGPVGLGFGTVVRIKFWDRGRDEVSEQGWVLGFVIRVRSGFETGVGIKFWDRSGQVSGLGSGWVSGSTPDPGPFPDPDHPTTILDTRPQPRYQT